jgi:hypothetical protein
MDILELRVNLSYDAQLAMPAADENTPAVSRLSGILYGKLRIGKLLLELAYISQVTDSGTKEHVFYAQADLAKLLQEEYNAPARADTKADAPGGIDLAALATASSMEPSDIKLPPASSSSLTTTTTDTTPPTIPSLTMVSPLTLGARVRLIPENRVEVWAAGTKTWSGDVCGVTVSLEKLMAFFRYTQGAFQPGTQDRFPATYEAYLRGRVDVKGYVAAEAQLSIGKESHATFTALLARPGQGQGSVDVFGSVVDDMAASSTSSSSSPSSDGQSSGAWKDMVPAFKEPMVFEQQSKLFMFADFKSKKLVLAATVQDFGAALLLGRDPDAESEVPKPDEAQGSEPGMDDDSKLPAVPTKKKSSGRKYIFFLEVRDLNRLWAETQDDVAAQFNISRVSVQVIGYQTTLKQLREDIAAVTTGVGESNTDPTKSIDGAASTQASSQSGLLDPLTAAPAKTALELFSGMDESMEFVPGAWIIAELNLGTAQQDKKAMTGVLTLDASNITEGQTTTRPTVRLYAKVVKKTNHLAGGPDGGAQGGQQQPNGDNKDSEVGPPKEEQQTEYGIDIRNLQIFDGLVTIDGSGKYLPKGKELSIDARLGLRLSASAAEDQLKFDVKLTMNETTTSFEVGARTTSTQSLTNPFSGGMFNVKLEGLKVKGSSTKKAGAPGGVERKCTIYGAALLGGSNDGNGQKARLLGLIHFENGKPVLAVVDFTRRVVADDGSAPSQNGVTEGADAESKAMVPWEKQDVPVKMTDIYSDILQPNPGAGDSLAAYPDDCDDFALNEAYMSYNRTDADVVVGSRTYQSGFIIYGAFLLFQQPVSVSLRIKEKRQGFKLSGTYAKTLDLGILKFTSFDNKTLQRKGDGLTVSLETTNGVSTDWSNVR